jgi:hypothetical protein
VSSRKPFFVSLRRLSYFQETGSPKMASNSAWLIRAPAPRLFQGLDYVGASVGPGLRNHDGRQI